MSKEYCCATDRVTISARTRFFGEATATIEAAGEREIWQSRRIGRLTVEYSAGLLRTKKVEIPAAALREAGAVYINQWEFRDEDSVRRGVQCLYLVVIAPHEISPGVCKEKTIHFVFEDGTFKNMTVQTPIGEDSWQHHRFEH